MKTIIVLLASICIGLWAAVIQLHLNQPEQEVQQTWTIVIEDYFQWDGSTKYA